MQELSVSKANSEKCGRRVEKLEGVVEEQVCVCAFICLYLLASVSVSVSVFFSFCLLGSAFV